MEKISRTIVLIMMGLSLVTGQISTGISPVLSSLVIPGSGEFTLQQNDRGRAFLLMEGLLWLSVISCNSASDYMDQTMRGFASNHAGVQTAGKDDQFWIDIGNYNTRDAFNDEHRRWRETDALYDMTEEWNWSWDSTPSRKEFERMRIRRDRLHLSGKFLVGGIVINHVVSAIDALYLNRKLSNSGFSISPNYLGNNATIQASIQF